MKKYLNYKKLAFLFVILFPMVGRAIPPEWQIDPSQSSLSFIATQNGAPVNGQFKTFTGEIFVDPADYKASKVHIVIDINSLTTDYADVRSTLLTPDWFDVKMFPKAEFKSTDFSQTGVNAYQANGNLTIRDKSVPITLIFTTQQPSPDIGVVEGNTVLNRSTFGVGQGEWSSTEQIQDDVKVNFKIVAKRNPK